VRTRQPISRVLVRAPDDAAAQALDSHKDQILEELNVKDIEFIARDAGLVSYVIKPNLPKLGKQYGKLLPRIRQALMDADGAEIAGAAARGEAFEIAVDGETIALEGDDVLIETHSAEGYSCEADSGYLAALDTTLDDELIAEGLAREVVRSVQDARKQAGLEVSDRITLGVSGSEAVEKALAIHRAYLMNETLATNWQVGQDDARYMAEKTMGDEHWTIEISL
jgi:isoleucyl-tRNA synthetase